MITHPELIRQLKKQVKECGNQKVMAMRLGISEQYMSDILTGKRMPGEQVLQALNLKRVICYTQIRGNNRSQSTEIRINTFAHHEPETVPESATATKTARELGRGNPIQDSRGSRTNTPLPSGE